MNQGKPVLASMSPVIGAGLTIAGWVVVFNVGWQVLAGLTQAVLCEVRSTRPLECLPAWTQMGEIGRRSGDTLLALVVHSPADSASAALGGLAGAVLVNRKSQQKNNDPSHVSSILQITDNQPDDQDEPK